jgi:hypothetical protein
MAFNGILGNTTWKTARSDSKIVDLAIGSESDRFTQILDLLTTNKNYYLENGTSEDEWTLRYNRFKCDDDILSLATGSASDRFDQIIELLKTNKEYYLEANQNTSEDQWLDRVLHFAYQRGPNVSGYPFTIDDSPVLPVDYMDAKDIAWFNSDIRWEIVTNILINTVDEKGVSWYASATEKTLDDNIMGPSDSQISSLSWLPSNCISLHNKLISSSYSKYIYIIKLHNVHLRYSEPSKTFGEIETENTTAISNLNTEQLTNLLSYVRETYASRPDDKKNEDVEAACEMLEFDIAQ